MPSERTLIDVIAALPPEELDRLRERNRRDLARVRAEVARLEVQEHQFELAIARKERRKPGRPGKLTPEVVLEAASQTEAPMTAAAVTETLVSGGLAVTVNAVRNHLNKLVQDGDLEKDDEGRFVQAKPVYVPEDFAPQASAADDDIPF